jgi:DNA-binding LacI/PurR family transcriptional regulator
MWLRADLKRTFTIGLVYNIASPFTPVLIRAIQEYLRQHGYFSITISRDCDLEHEAYALHPIISRSIEWNPF